MKLATRSLAFLIAIAATTSHHPKPFHTLITS